MSTRAFMLLAVLATPACAFVSGLANLEVTDASTPIDAASEADVAALLDASPDVGPIEAGEAGYALQASGGCASSGVTISLSNLEFSLSLWLRVDSTNIADSDVLPIVWNGGRAPSEQGWSLNLTKGGVEFCVADQNGNTCTPKWPIPVLHLVHVFVTSPYTGQTSGRSLNIYAHDISDGSSTTHASVATVSGAQGNWATSAPFTIGGAQIGPSCTSPAHVTVDRVIVYSGIVPTNVMDIAETHNVCTSTNALADYEMDEGAGKVAKDCVTANTSLTFSSSSTSFVVSPFR
jgi:hypothetical protein